MEVRKILRNFKVQVNVLSLDDKITDLALNSDFKYFEDAIQYFTAVENDQDVIITRNLPILKKAKFLFLQPGNSLKP